MRQAGQARAAGRKARSAGPHAAAAGRKARSAGPQAAAAERPRGAGNIFAPCVISGSPTRKRALGGKIRAPCILNRPIAPGNGCMGRGCCHLDLEKHAFQADVARKRAFFAHLAKKGCMRCDSCQPGPGADATREGTRVAARGGTNPRPRSARNRRPSGAGSGARQGWGRGMAGALGAGGGAGPGFGWRWSGPRRCQRACIGGRDASAWAAAIRSSWQASP